VIHDAGFASFIATVSNGSVVGAEYSTTNVLASCNRATNRPGSRSRSSALLAASNNRPRMLEWRCDASPATVIVHVCGADRAPPPDVNAANARCKLGVTHCASSSITTSVGL
jgi:hypothetical protein